MVSSWQNYRVVAAQILLKKRTLCCKSNRLYTISCLSDHFLDEKTSKTDPDNQLNCKHDVVGGPEILEQCDGVVRDTVECHVEGLGEQTGGEPYEDCVPHHRAHCQRS